MTLQTIVRLTCDRCQYAVEYPSRNVEGPRAGEAAAEPDGWDVLRRDRGPRQSHLCPACLGSLAAWWALPPLATVDVAPLGVVVELREAVWRKAQAQNWPELRVCVHYYAGWVTQASGQQAWLHALNYSVDLLRALHNKLDERELAGQV